MANADGFGWYAPGDEEVGDRCSSDAGTCPGDNVFVPSSRLCLNGRRRPGGSSVPTSSVTE